MQPFETRRPVTISTNLPAIIRGRDAIDDYAETNCPGNGPGPALTALLFDLMHWASARTIGGFDASLKAAQEHFAEDLEDQGKNRG